MVVYEKPRRRNLPGTTDEFRHGFSFEKLGRRQGVKLVDRIETVLGGWPTEELEDGFEAELADWRRQGAPHLSQIRGCE
jgi:hypothetical protein